MLSNTFSEFASDVRVTDIMINNIENKIESLHLQECSLKTGSLLKLFC